MVFLVPLALFACRMSITGPMRYPKAPPWAFCLFSWEPFFFLICRGLLQYKTFFRNFLCVSYGSCFQSCNLTGCLSFRGTNGRDKCPGRFARRNPRADHTKLTLAIGLLDFNLVPILSKELVTRRNAGNRCSQKNLR